MISYKPKAVCEGEKPDCIKGLFIKPKAVYICSLEISRKKLGEARNDYRVEFATLH